MNKGIVRDAIILFIITLIAGFGLGAVHEITLAPIQAAQAAAATATYQEVYPDAVSFEELADLEAVTAAATEELAGKGFGKVSVDDAKLAKDASGNTIGYLITTTSKEGYKGDIQVATGITTEGNITGIGFLSIDETPGLGMKAKEPAFKDQFSGKPAATFTVSKTGATSDDQVNAISGATFSSNATTNAVNAAVYFAENCIK